MRRWRFSLIPVLVLLPLVAVGVVAGEYGLPNPASLLEGSPAPTPLEVDGGSVRVGDPVAAIRGRVVVVADPGVLGSELPDLSHPTKRIDVARVADGGQLRATLDDTVVAIAVHSSVKDSVDWGWLSERLAEGRVLAGININISEFIERLAPASDGFRGEGAPGYGAPFPPERHFVSMLTSGAVGACARAGTFPYDGEYRGSFIGMLYSHLGCANPLFNEG